MKKIWNLLFKSKANKIQQYNIPEYIIFNVINFNTWFCSQKDVTIYANKGIFLRLDKLSYFTIEQYIINAYGIDINTFQWSKDYNLLQEEMYNSVVSKWKLIKRNKAKAKKRKIVFDNIIP